MRLGIITEWRLTQRHGTGAQILRTLGDTGIPMFHLYLFPGYPGPSECARSYYLHDPHWTFRRGIGRLMRLAGLAWWDGTKLNARKFRGLQRGHDLTCDVAYVVLGQEEAACKMLSVLDLLGCPYVVHIMDLYHDQGLDPATMPGFCRLLRGAASVIVITEAIRDEVLKFGIVDAKLILIGQQPSAGVASPPHGQTVKMVMVGRAYPGGTELIASAWPTLKERFPQLELIYTGHDSNRLAPALRSAITDYGFISEPARYKDVVASSHLAYLSGPSELDNYGRYSFPSRSADYLMAGLPVLACVACGSAAERAFAPLIPTSVRLTRTVEELCAAIECFTASPERWNLAHQHARQYALRHFSLETVRGQILDELRNAVIAAPDAAARYDAKAEEIGIPNERI